MRRVVLYFDREAYHRATKVVDFWGSRVFVFAVLASWSGGPAPAGAGVVPVARAARCSECPECPECQVFWLSVAAGLLRREPVESGEDAVFRRQLPAVVESNPSSERRPVLPPISFHGVPSFPGVDFPFRGGGCLAKLRCRPWPWVGVDEMR